MESLGVLANGVGAASGLIALCDKAFLISRVANSYRSAPDDLARLLAMLYNESEKLYIWTLETATIDHLNRYNAMAPDLADLNVRLHDQLARQIEEIRCTQCEIEIILNKYINLPLEGYPELGIEEILLTLFPTSNKQEARASLLKAKAQRKQMEMYVKSQMEVKKKILLVAKPWAESDRQAITVVIDRLRYWNGEFISLASRHQQRLFQDEIATRIMGETNGDINALNTIASNSTGISEDLVASANLTIRVLEPVCDNPGAEDYKIPYARLRFESSGSDTHGRLLDPLDGSQSQRVYIDWLDYAGLSYDQAELAIGRINNLCKLLRSSKPKRLQILPTLGFVNDRTRSRFGILSCLPIEKTIVSLNQILSNKRLYERPSLGKRISLARQMCWSILELHKSRWLHRGFNCSSVLFSFASKPAKQGNSLLSFSKEDFAAVGGFQYTRPVGREQVSLPIRESSIENAQLYHHPKVRENLFAPEDSGVCYTKYEPRYDIYSLGVVLLEIGLWKTIDQLEPKHTKDPKVFHTSLTRIAKTNLPFAMGQLYTDIVVHCLNGPEETMGLGVERDANATSINWLLYDIVKPLDSCLCGNYY